MTIYQHATPNGLVATPAVVPPSRPLDHYSFFQALRQIERQRLSQPRIGHAARPSDEPVRIGQPAELTFAPSTLISAQARNSNSNSHNQPDYQSTGGDERQLPPVSVQQRFLGLLGPAGPMPLHFTEWVRDRQRHAHDEALQAFLDLFHHRMATLFYRAWSDAQPIVQHDRPLDDRFARFLGSLAGAGATGARGGQHPLGNCARLLAGHFAGGHRHAEGLESILSHVLQSPTRVSSFALRTLVLACSERSSLSSQRSMANLRRASNCLGSSAQLGTTVADRSSMIEVRVGPVTYDQFQQYLPHGPARLQLTSVIGQYAGVGTDARVIVDLHKDHVPLSVLGRAGQLGRTSWMHSHASQRNRDDYRFEISGIPEVEATLPVRGAL